MSAASTPYGKVLVIGSGDYAGCSLYVLTSDPRPAQAGDDFACSDTPVSQLGNPTCFQNLWPALLTHGTPIAGPGVNPTLLGTVQRTVQFPGSDPMQVQQVTYAGQALYRFFRDETAGQTDGANLFDNVVDPTGVWYLVEPSRGRIAPGTAHLEREDSSSNSSTGPGEPVLGVSLNPGFEAFPNALFPVYSFTGDSKHKSGCTAECAVNWPPVLTSGRPQAGAGVDQHRLGIIVRPDGAHQVTYDGKPLYLFVRDAYILGLTGTGFDTPKGVTGDNVSAFGGTFNAIPLSP